MESSSDERMRENVVDWRAKGPRTSVTPKPRRFAVRFWSGIRQKWVPLKKTLFDLPVCRSIPHQNSLQIICPVLRLSAGVPAQALEDQASRVMLARKLKNDDHAADVLAAEVSRITGLIESYAAEIARLEETLAENEAAARELDAMLHAGEQALERLHLMPNKEKRRFMSACGLQVAIFPMNPGPRFKLLWRLAYMQTATLQALSKEADGTLPETEAQQVASSFALGTKIDPKPARSFLHAR
jgi:hypothetical protein